MDIKKYGEEVMARLDAMSDEEFNNMLNECGLEKCPYQIDMIALRMKSVYDKYPRTGEYDINPDVFKPEILELIRFSIEDED